MNEFVMSARVIEPGSRDSSHRPMLCPDHIFIQVDIRNPVNAKLYKQLLMICSAYFHFVSANIIPNA